MDRRASGLIALSGASLPLASCCPLPPLHFEARGLPRSKAVIFPVSSPALSAFWTPPGLFCALFSGRRKENRNFFEKKYCFFGRVMVLYQSRHDATEYGRLAQLVEHLLDVQEVTGSSPVPSTKRKPLTKVSGFFVASATVSRQSRTVQGSNRAAARSAVSNQPSGLLLSPRFPIFRNVYQESTACRSTVCRASVGRDRTGTMYVRAIRKKQRQGITVAVVSCLFRIWDGLSAGGMVYSAQQIGI